MARGQLILDRYEPLGTAGAGGFGTVCIAWDPRIQRKVAIKTIELSEIDAWRAGLPGADAVAGAVGERAASTIGRWHGVQPWSEYLSENDAGWPGEVRSSVGLGDDRGYGRAPAEYGPDDIDEPVTALAHVPGLDEARTAAKLQDQRIVGVFDFEVRDQVAYLIMEYVEGITLTRLMSQYENYLTLDVVAAVFDAVAGALTVAHKAGVLHLDIKPDNILINPEGQVKVTDFGLATLADASGTGLAGGGTIGYMPLEQMRREPLDARTDEWALASVTYEMLTGENPFRADTLAHAEAAIENAELVLPSLCWDNVDDQIDDVIFYALDPERDERYATVADFAEEAEKFLGSVQAGRRQLSAIVRDYLGTLDDGYEEDSWEYGGEDDSERYGEYDSGFDAGEDLTGRDGARSQGSGWIRRQKARLSASGAWRSAVPAIGRLLVGIMTGFQGFTSMQAIYQLAPLFGRDATFAVALVCAGVIAVVGMTFPHVGVLAACILGGFWLVAAGWPVVGAALIVVGLVWCYAFARLARQPGHPAVLSVLAICCAAGLAILAVFANVPQQHLAPLALAACAVLSSVVVVLAER